ncbi:MAG TPA: NAD(P)-dependent oxidoreductase [Ktedonobacteraceae bacterium]|nr:NAD(P)-dependent oxidoreductase [Ktedonobacteraceae bacterium]
MAERLGFIGLGIMGRALSHNLLRAGYRLTVFNRSQPALDELVQAGTRAAASPREVAEQSDIVLSAVSDTAAVEEIVTGPNGLLAGAHQGLLFIDTSTISPEGARRIAATAAGSGVHMLDAPVSGGDVGARAGTLTIMVGGERADFERAYPIFEVLGKTIVHCGAIGAGQTVKACNQIVIALILEGIVEGLVLGSKMGVSPEILVRVISGGLAQNRLLDLRGPHLIQRSFEPGARAKLHYKDLGIALEMAREHKVALPGTALVEQLLMTLIEGGMGELDHTALLTVIETLSHHSLPLPTES